MVEKGKLKKSDNSAHIDYINRDDIIDMVYNHISSLQVGDTKRICLFGEWGSGKSYTLEILKERLKKDVDWESKYIVVYYDAWKNIFYDDPLIAMIYSIGHAKNEVQCSI